MLEWTSTLGAPKGFGWANSPTQQSGPCSLRPLGPFRARSGDPAGLLLLWRFTVWAPRSARGAIGR